jgi:hypothetical protein
MMKACMQFAGRAAIVTGAGLVASLAGCSSPTHPSVSVASGRPVSPTNGTQFSYYSQPITLVVANGVATGGASPTTAVEVATDAAFSAVVTTQPVSPGANGQPTITLDHLTPATTYYWRVKTAAGDNPGVFSSAATFSIGPRLVIQPPVPVRPLAGSFPHKRPTFIVTNATHTGPAATLTYQFDVAAEVAFSQVVMSGTVPEGSGQTSFVPAVDLTSGATYYWRVQAIDAATGVKSDFAMQSFSTIMPDDGNYRYDLLIQVPALCPSYLTQPAHEFRFDDNLAVDAGRLRFSLPQRYYLGIPTFAVDIVRDGSRLSGTIGGAGVMNQGISFEIWRTFWEHAFPPPSVEVPTFTGSTDNKGRLTGTFNGSVESKSCCDQYAWCIGGTGLNWTLTPHR